MTNKQDNDASHVFLLYHFFHPDDVISARLFSDLAIVLTKAGAVVHSFPSVRSSHGGERRYPSKETWDGGVIERIWRPNLRQSSGVGRIINTIFMLIGWTWKAAFAARVNLSGSNDSVVIGTDPIFGVLAAIPWRIFRPKAKIVHWCHDLHPEASIAEGSVKENALLVKLLKWLILRAYKCCDVLIDLGPCMRRRMEKATTGSRGEQSYATVTPWSLIEPSNPTPVHLLRRDAMFGPCALSLLYSGNLGKAHEFDLFLKLARMLRENSQIKFCFAGRGTGIEALAAGLTPEDTNISLAGFASEDELQERLAACDIHLVSLKENWTGTVVPSKFFGAIAIGRPVPFSGSADSSIAKWITEFGVGWHVGENNLDAVSKLLLEYSNSCDKKRIVNESCFNVYQANFSKDVQLKKMLELLRPYRAESPDANIR